MVPSDVVPRPGRRRKGPQRANAAPYATASRPRWWQDGPKPAGTADKADAERELSTILEAEIADESVVALHPAAVETYRRKIETLHKGWSDDGEARREAMNAMRALIARIEITPGERRGETHVRNLG